MRLLAATQSRVVSRKQILYRPKPMPDFEPQDPNYRTRVDESFSRQAFMRTLGAELIRLEPGLVEISLPFSDDLTQQHGFLHAGAVASVADSACGFAAFSLMPSDAAVLTVEYKINLLAPARSDRFTARGVVKKAGRTLMVSTADVFGDDSETVATMTATIMVVRGREISG